MISIIVAKTAPIFIGLGIIGAVGFILLMLFHTTRSILLSYGSDILCSIKKWQHRFRLGRKFRQLIRSKPYEYSIHLMFETFADFYERNFHREKSWELDPIAFPEGMKELTEWYLWIRGVRDDNFTTVNNISFDLQTGMILIFGHLYPDFSTSIDRYKRVHIQAIPEGEPIGFLGYSTKMNKIHEKLNTMDNDICSWIIKNRKHFAF